MTTPLLPLEEQLRMVAGSRNDFPDRTVDYFDRYMAIKHWLAQNAFRNAGAGLSADDGGLYTQHDLGHVEDVIESAGRLLGVAPSRRPVEKPPISLLTPYEVYAALIGILLHDAGNAQGRQGHEQRAFQYLGEIGTAVTGMSKIENRYLASIAKAHGGRTSTDSKDTIGTLTEETVCVGNDIPLRVRLVAALVRFADEISENPRRANTVALRRPYANPASVVHNLYCLVTSANVDLSGRTISFEYAIPVEYLDEKFICGKTDVYLVEYIAERLLKCDRERRYCQRFFRDILVLDRIRATVHFERNHEWLEHVIHGELSEVGYPGEEQDARKLLPQFDGKQLSGFFGSSG